MAFVEISTENPLGKRPLNLMARQQNLGWLGAAPTPGDYDNNQAVLGQLVAMGAISQDDANMIWAGSASLDDMAVNMTMINQALALTGQMGAQTVQPLPPSTSTPLPTASTPALTVVPYTPGLPASTPAPQAAAAPQIPPGSTIVYTATYNPVPGWTTANSAIAALGAQLPAHGMSILTPSVASSGLVSNAAFSVTILDSIGHALMSDAKSVLDSLMQALTHNALVQSSIAMVSAGPNPGGSPVPAAAGSVTSFLENNAMMLAFLVLGVVALPPLIKKL